MRKRYTHTNATTPFRIRNRFSHSSYNEAAHSYDNDVNMITELSNDNDNIDENDEITEPHYDEDDEEGDEPSDDDEEEDDEITEPSDEDDDEEEDDEITEPSDDNDEQKDNNNNNDEEESNDDNNVEEERVHHIVEALDEDKIPSCDGEFAPYFNNYTTAALFCWLQKHNISTNAYEDLVSVIHNPQFDPTHVVKNVRRFRSWRKHLPLLPITTKSIKILSKKTPSTSRGSKLAYQFSISEIIWRVLNNPMLMKHMYFGPGVNSEIKSEYWHGTLWGESPLFGQNEITISEGNN